MPTKAELVDEAEAAGIEIPMDATKSEIEALLNGDETTEEDAPEFPAGVDDGVIGETRAKVARIEAEAAEAAEGENDDAED